MAIKGRNNPRNNMNYGERNNGPQIGKRRRVKISTSGMKKRMSAAQRAALLKAQKASAEARKRRGTKMGVKPR